MNAKSLAHARRLAATFAFLAAGVAHAQSFENAAGLKASDLVPPALLKGPNHRVDDAVTFEGGFPLYTIRSDNGTWQARGREMLEIRVSELPAFAQANRVSKTDEFGKAAAQALAAPVKAVGQLVENPVETVGNVFSGFGLMASRIGEVTGSTLGNVGDTVSGDTGAQKPILKQTALSKGVTGPRAFDSDPFGYNAKRREWANQLKVDPYTNNAALAAKLDDLASASFAGSFPVDVTLGVVAAPLKYAVEFNETAQIEAYQYPPVDIEMRNTERLKKMGITDLPVRTLFRNAYFTPTLQTALVLALESLGNAGGRVEVVRFAARAASDIEARYVVNSVALLARHDRTVAPIVGVQGAGNVLAGRTADRKLIVVVPMDYIPWAKPVEDFARRADLQGAERWVLVSGRVTPLAKQEIAKLGWRVSDNLTNIR